MRTVTVDLFTTVDGYASGTNAEAYFGLLGPDLRRWIDVEIAEPQTVVMGRVTYEQLATIAATGEYADNDTLTALPKIVFSRTLREPLPWANTQLIAADVAEAVPALKRESGDRLRVMGSPTLVTALLAAGLVDRLRLIVFPLVLGATGRDPILAGVPDLELDLLDSTTLDGRLVVLDYRPITRPA